MLCLVLEGCGSCDIELADVDADTLKRLRTEGVRHVIPKCLASSDSHAPKMSIQLLHTCARSGSVCSGNTGACSASVVFYHGTPFLSVHLEVVQLVFFLRRCISLFLFFGKEADAFHFLDAVTHVALFPLPGGGVEPSLRRFLRHQLLGLSGHGHCWLLPSVFSSVCLRMGDRR